MSFNSCQRSSKDFGNRWRQVDTYNHVKLGVDIDQSALRVDDRQSRDSPLDELLQGDDDGSVRMSCFDVLVRANPQLPQRFEHVTGFRHFIHLQHNWNHQVAIDEMDHSNWRNGG